ncbi:MAG: serine protease [Chloroflexi bacterium]|nr:serine protease [Chloroflexota bacterium]
MTIDFKRIEQYIKNATVKIVADNAFSGTGFFITADGFVLTAYHCVADAKTIQIETPYDGRFTATLHRDKSLTANDLDLAVLQVPFSPSHYLPLGYALESYISDNVVAIGYPASYLRHNEGVGVYKGHLSRWRGDNYIELSDGIKGKGQSGGAIYHYQSQRVVGVVVERYRHEVMVDAGLATRLNALFEKWPALSTLNTKVGHHWDEELKAITASDVNHPIIFAMIPTDVTYRPLREAVRELVENRWECQLLTATERQYSDNQLDNIRAHLAQADAFMAEVSTADPEVMFSLGATYFYLDNRLTILLAQADSDLPSVLRGQAIVSYTASAVAAADLQRELHKVEALTHLLNAPHREHFWSIAKLQQLTNHLPLPDETWRRMQARFPTREAWQRCDATALEPLLDKENRDLAPVLLQRLRRGMV